MEVRTKNLSFGVGCAMTLLTLLLLWACESLGGWGALLLPIVLLPLSILCAERQPVAYALAVLLPGALILLLPFMHYAWFGFAFVLSWYAPVRRMLEKTCSVVKGGLLALALCNAGLVLGLAALRLLGAHPLMDLDPLAVVLILFGAEIECLLLDVAFHLFTRLWTRRLRRALMV